MKARRQAQWRGMKPAHFFPATLLLVVACGQEAPVPQKALPDAKTSTTVQSKRQKAPQPKQAEGQPPAGGAPIVPVGATWQDLSEKFVATLKADDAKAALRLTFLNLPNADAKVALRTMFDAEMKLMEDRVKTWAASENPGDQERARNMRAALDKGRADFEAGIDDILAKEVSGEREAFPAKFTQLLLQLKKAGLDPAQAKLAKVEPIGPRDGRIQRDVVLSFTVNGEPAKAMIELPCLSVPGYGWVISDQPKLQQPAKVEEGWTTNLEEALAAAKQKGTAVFIDFTGSDWCPPCIALHDRVLTQPVFKAFAKAHLELVVLDFPRRTALPAKQAAYNQGLAERFKVNGFPTVVLLDGEGKELHREVGAAELAPAKYVAQLKAKLGK